MTTYLGCYLLFVAFCAFIVLVFGDDATYNAPINNSRHLRKRNLWSIHLIAVAIAAYCFK